MSKDLIYAESREDPYRILIPPLISDQLNYFKQVSQNDLEAGGLLLGFRRGPHIEVISITTPFPKDIRTRTSFHRRDFGHFMFADQLWIESQHTIGYVGEWHTHPESTPTPSGVDAIEWRRVMRAEKQTTAFIIVGTLDWYVGRGPVGCRPGLFSQDWESLVSIL